MSRTVAGWFTAVIGVAILVGGFSAGQMYQTAGIVVCIAGTALVISSQLEFGRTRAIGVAATQTAARHARSITSGRSVVHMVATYGSMLLAGCGAAAAHARGAVAKQVRSVARPGLQGPALYGFAAAVAGAALLIVGVPGVGPDASGPAALPPAHAEPMPSASWREPVEPIETLATSAPTPTTDSAGGSLSAGPNSDDKEPATRLSPPAAEVEVGGEETVEPTSPPDGVEPEPEPEITAEPEPTPIITASPAPVPPLPPDKGKEGDGCLLFVGIPRLLELCLLGEL